MKRLIPLLLLMVLTAGLQIGISLRQGLWADEIFSLAMATGHSVEHPPTSAKPELGDFVESEGPVAAADLRRYVEFETPTPGFRRVVRAVKLSDTSPPLYYLLLHLWTRVFGTSDMALRTLSIVFSLACLPLIVAVGRALESERAGWFAAVLFAAAPLSLYYSTEGRMYSLLWFCVLVQGLATLALHRGGSRRVVWQITWIGAAVAGMLVHYYYAFPLVGFGAFLLFWPGSDKRGLLILRTVVVIGLLLPWYWDFQHVLTQWRITQHWIEWPPENYRPLVVARDLLIQYFSGNGHYLWDPHRMAEVAALIVFLLVGLVAWRKQSAQSLASVSRLPLLWFGTACFGPLIADLIRHTYIAEYPRYSSTALPAACLLGGIVLGRLRSRSTWVALAVILIAWSPNAAAVLRNRGRSYEPMRDVARHVSLYGRPDDLVLIHSIPTGAISLARYCTTPAGFATWIGQLGHRKVPDSLQTLVSGRRRVLLVKVHTVGEPAPEEVWLRENAALVKEQQLAGVFISEFKPRSAETF